LDGLGQSQSRENPEQKIKQERITLPKYACLNINFLLKYQETYHLTARF
jgi:hypothetical protein